MVKIEIDGQQFEARDGDMVIEAADAAGIYIPRFCYHKKLSIAANCRMCLVEVEKARKPLPACSTPVTDGMKVLTKSKNALAAQKGVMEFLLINHPLDCPICDQGGECELQDIAMGYGGDVSRYTERKRVVPDKNIGPLISTDMTRCIHCTRCVRFGEEIAGIKELGATGRGEHMQIGTYIEHAVESEMSGNVIDLCPVGALTSKPFRFSARAWEMKQSDSIAAHDCLGSNTHVHTKSSSVMRIVPKDNESVNETWLSDRDRFSYQGNNSSDRALQPMIKENGQWRTVDWETGLNKAFTGLNKALNESVDQVGVLASPNSTTEELYLLQKLARSQGISNLDHRLRQQDFASQTQQSAYRSLGLSIEALDKLNAALFIGSNVRKDQPIAGNRIRKAALSGAAISFINSKANGFRFPTKANIAAADGDIVLELSAVLAAIKNAKLNTSLKALVSKAKATDDHKAIAESLSKGESSALILGAEAINHAQASTIETLASAIAEATKSNYGYLTEGANCAGASLAGILPHRLPGGAVADKTGLNALEMLSKPLSAYLLLGLEAEFDTANPVASVNALSSADCVVSLSAYVTEELKQYADVILPVASVWETAGTFVNTAGTAQSFNGVVAPKGEARPAWKVLRVIGNLFEADGFDYMSVEDVYSEMESMINITDITNKPISVDTQVSADQKGLRIVGGTAIHGADAIVRRAEALQSTQDALMNAQIGLSETTASSFSLYDGDEAVIKQGENQVTGIVRIDKELADMCVAIPSGTLLSAGLGSSAINVSIEKSASAEQNSEEIVRASNA